MRKVQNKQKEAWIGPFKNTLNLEAGSHYAAYL